MLLFLLFYNSQSSQIVGRKGKEEEEEEEELIHFISNLLVDFYFLELVAIQLLKAIKFGEVKMVEFWCTMAD